MEYQLQLNMFLASESRPHEKTFCDELWIEWGRIFDWDTPLIKRPQWWGSLVIELVYNNIHPEVATYLKANKPPEGVKWHQNLTRFYVVTVLIPTIEDVVRISRECDSATELRYELSKHFHKHPPQRTFYRELFPDGLGLDKKKKKVDKKDKMRAISRTISGRRHSGNRRVRGGITTKKGQSPRPGES